MNKQNKKILLIGDSFYPIIAPRPFRTTELAKEFARQGHEVKVIVPKEEKVHALFEKKYGVEIKDLGRIENYLEQKKYKNKIIYFFSRLNYRFKDIFFHYPQIKWVPKVIKALKDEKGFDLLISLSYPHPIHWGVALSRNEKHLIAKNWIADSGDPFMGATTDTFNHPFYFKYLERLWNKKCDFITVPFKGAINGYYKEFHNKIRIIPQGLSFEDFGADKNVFKPNKIVTFAYAGGFIPGARDPEALIDYILSKNMPFKFIVYTQTPQFINSIFKRAAGMIEIRDYIPRKELISELSKMDFILNLNNGVPTQLPSKLIDYYLTKRPVLSINSIGFDTKIIDEFLLGNYSNQFVYDNPDQYRIEHVAQQFLNLINK